MIRISQCRKSDYSTSTSVRRNKLIQKSRIVRVTVRDLSRKVYHWSKVNRDRKIITQFNRSTSSTRISQPVLMMDIKVFREKHISRRIDRENLSQMKQHQKLCLKWKKLISRGKRSNTLNEARPIENMSKNLQIFLEKSCVQQEALLSNKLQDHAYQ